MRVLIVVVDNATIKRLTEKLLVSKLRPKHQSSKVAPSSNAGIDGASDAGDEDDEGIEDEGEEEGEEEGGEELPQDADDVVYDTAAIKAQGKELFRLLTAALAGRIDYLVFDSADSVDSNVVVLNESADGALGLKLKSIQEELNKPRLCAGEGELHLTAWMAALLVMPADDWGVNRRLGCIVARSGDGDMIWLGLLLAAHCACANAIGLLLEMPQIAARGRRTGLLHVYDLRGGVVEVARALCPALLDADPRRHELLRYAIVCLSMAIAYCGCDFHAHGVYRRRERPMGLFLQDLLDAITHARQDRTRDRSS